jgi:phenylalanyl-tRNA synthetase beta chain
VVGGWGASGPGQRPAAVAGVMGGEESEVTETTRDIFLECAYFDPRSTRRTARSLGLATDSSYRFERGVDVDGMERAVRRALALILAVAGGEPEDVVDLYPSPLESPVVPLRPGRVNHVLGMDLAATAIRGHLELLGFRILGEDGASLRVGVPGYRRGDITREIDLIEEVARREGYDAFPADLRPFRPSIVPDDELARLEDRLRDLLVGHGFLEAGTAAFAPEAEGDVALVNPLSAAESRLRRDLLPGLLHRLEYNFARGARHVRLFEIGTVFGRPGVEGELPREATRIAAVFTGECRQYPDKRHRDAAPTRRRD